MKVKAGSALHKVLLALRAGPMDGSAIRERLPNTNLRICSWVKDGFIEAWGESSYRITEKGMDACPSRTEIANAPRDFRGKNKPKSRDAAAMRAV